MTSGPDGASSQLLSRTTTVPFDAHQSVDIVKIIPLSPRAMIDKRAVRRAYWREQERLVN
jgi:hypothetical protein